MTKMKRRRELLITLRNERNWTQQQAAETIGISTSRYGMYESGSRTPQPALMKTIADLFGSDMTEVFADVFAKSVAETGVTGSHQVTVRDDCSRARAG